MYDHAGVVLHAAAVHSSEFAIRSLVVDPTLDRENLALENDLGVSRHEQTVGLALDEPCGVSVEAAENLEVRGLRWNASQRSDLVERRTAQHDGDRHVLVARAVLEAVQPRAVARAGHIEVFFVLGSEHRAIDAPVRHAAVRVLRDHEVITRVRMAVAVVVEEQWQPRDVDVVTL